MRCSSSYGSGFFGRRDNYFSRTAYAADRACTGPFTSPLFVGAKAPSKYIKRVYARLAS